MPTLLCDPREWQDAPVVHGLEHIQARIPQRYEMGLLHGILHHDPAARLALGIHQSHTTDFWVRGHIPGRPLMPGVVMVEVAAQLCGWLASFDLHQEKGKIFGFGGIAASAAGMAKLLFFVFLILALLSFIFGRRVPSP